MKPALLIIDLQKAYYGTRTSVFMDGAVFGINRLQPAFRTRNLPIAWIQHIDEADLSKPGLPGFDFIDGLEPKEGDLRISKAYNDSFAKTGLAEMLRERDVDTVFVSGFCAEYCITATYFGARSNDFYPILVKRGLAGASQEKIDLVESSYESASIGAITRLLD
jgi:nicotinamidase-related amidase